MRKHRADLTILVLTLILMAIGLIVVYAIGPVRARFLNSLDPESNISDWYFFVKQLGSVVLGLGAFIVAYLVPYEKYRRFARSFFWFMIGVCVVMAIAAMAGGIGPIQAVNGAYRWISLGPLGSVQPSEFLKLAMIFYLGGLLAARRREKKLDKSDTIVPVLVATILSLGLVAGAQSDMGTALTLMGIIMMMVVGSGMKWRNVGIITGVLLLLGALFVFGGALFGSGYRMDRVNTFLHGGSEDESHHIENAVTAIGIGGFWGVGMGNSVQATGYLPESLNDSIFAIMGETFGFVGLMLVVGLFVGLILRILKVGEKLEDMEKKLIVYGVFGWVAGHTLVNIMAMTRLVPLTGITLPLLSYGGTSILVVSALLGVVMQFSCYTSRDV